MLEIFLIFFCQLMWILRKTAAATADELITFLSSFGRRFLCNFYFCHVNPCACGQNSIESLLHRYKNSRRFLFQRKSTSHCCCDACHLEWPKQQAANERSLFWFQHHHHHQHRFIHFFFTLAPDDTIEQLMEVGKPKMIPLAVFRDSIAPP